MSTRRILKTYAELSHSELRHRELVRHAAEEDARCDQRQAASVDSRRLLVSV